MVRQDGSNAARRSASSPPRPGPPRPGRPSEAIRLGEVHVLRRGAQFSRLAAAEDDQVLGVLSGALRTCRILLDGRRQVLAFLLPDEWCWLQARRGHPTTVEAVAETQVVWIPRHVLAAANSNGSHLVQSIMRDSLTAALDRNVTLGQKSARDKLAAFLLDLSDRLVQGGEEFILPMSRYDIADYLGLRSETVCRTLMQLAAADVIAMPEPQRVRILDRATLEVVLS